MISRSEPIELVVFDVAGTTIRDAGQVAEAFEQTLRARGVELSPETLRHWRGASKRRALKHLLEQGGREVSTASLEEAYGDFRARLVELFESRGVEAVPGAPEALARLRARGLRLALTSGFDRDILALLLEAVGWNERTVDAVVCGEDVPQGRPAPYMIFRAMERTQVVSVQRVVNVGDTALDLQSAANAGVRGNIGVLSGAHGRAQLEPEPHTHLLPSVAELPGLLADVEGRVVLPD